jgi:hypothetical protein
MYSTPPPFSSCICTDHNGEASYFWGGDIYSTSDRILKIICFISSVQNLHPIGPSNEKTKRLLDMETKRLLLRFHVTFGCLFERIFWGSYTTPFAKEYYIRLS